MKHPIANISQSGSSLVEILLVVVIIGFITLLVLNLPSSIGLIGTSKNNSLANDIALKKIEQLRLATYDNLANGTNTLNDPRLTNLPSGNGIYVIEDCPASICTQNELIKKATVTVSWKEKDQTKNLALVTFISKGGLK